MRPKVPIPDPPLQPLWLLTPKTGYTLDNKFHKQPVEGVKGVKAHSHGMIATFISHLIGFIGSDTIVAVVPCKHLYWLLYNPIVVHFPSSEDVGRQKFCESSEIYVNFKRICMALNCFQDEIRDWI